MMAGCQAQSKPPAAGTTPTVLNVAAPRSPHQASVYAVPASYAAPSQPSGAAAGPAYLPPDGSDTAAPPAGLVAPAPQQTLHPAPTPSPATKAQSRKAGGKTYVVKVGDTLFRIARERYGSGAKWRQIAAANPGLTPANLKAGQKLLMP
jgi:5'-nucleotidase